MVPASGPWGLCAGHFMPDTLLRLGSRSEFGADAPPKGGRKADHGPEGPGDVQDQRVEGLCPVCEKETIL